MLVDQINLLDGMQEHAGQAHAALASHLLFLTTITIDPVPQPPLPDVAGEASVIVPSRAEKVVLPLVRKDARPGATSGAIAAVIEDGGEVRRWPAAVDVDGVRGVYGFEAVVESARARPHLAEHRVALQCRLPVHGFEQAAGESRGSDNGCAAGWEAGRYVVARHIFSEKPICARGVEEWVECYEVSFFANTPLVVVFVVLGRRKNVSRGVELVAWACGWMRAPYRSFGVAGAVGRRLGIASRGYLVIHARLVGCTVFSLKLDKLLELVPCTVLGRHVKAAITLPESLARLSSSPLGDLVEEVVVVTGVSCVHFPMPKVIILWMHVGKVLDRHIR